MRSTIRVAVAAAFAVGATMAPLANATTHSPSARYSWCPKGYPLVHRHTHWHRNWLAPGVTLRQAELRDRYGKVDVHVVRADLSRPGVSLQPLSESLNSVHRLTHLAAPSTVVAATNGMYFNFPNGGPVVPFIQETRPQVMSVAPHRVIGVGTNGLMEDGDVSLKAQITVGSTVLHLTGVNQARPLRGLTLYTPAWGRAPVPMTQDSQSRTGSRGTIGGLGTTRRVPVDGFLLVATGGPALRHLRDLETGDPVSLSGTAPTGAIQSTATHPFDQAYGVGTQLVEQRGHVMKNLYCRSSALIVPRTAIGWADGGRQLILAVVTVRPGTKEHGLDENQMSYLMVELGAQRAYALDGGGSSEMVARAGKANYPKVLGGRSGHQRPIPLGLGVVVQH